MGEVVGDGIREEMGTRLWGLLGSQTSLAFIMNEMDGCKRILS